MGVMKRYLAELEEKGEVWKALQKLEKATDKIKKLVPVKKDNKRK